MNTLVPGGRPADPAPGGGIRLLVAFILVGAAVSVALGVYGGLHLPTRRALATLGFPSLVSMKVTLASAAAVLGVVQIVTALRMYGRIGHGPAPRAVATTHRISGVTAVLVSVPVAFHCLWSLGFGTYSARVLAHSLFGCAFYGVFVTKMLVLRSRRVPAWAVPLLGGALFTVIVVVWLTSAMWFLIGGPGY
ncbi:hypothetical protein GA0111570_11165 [Raineyella antarctica]|uniref:Uncharacterized protein n=1 Tax=Raineyella antarctica TaxID=1577474 RepID=A0A1G6HLI7_9ACTN|nr:DUF6529 family protein [Raineyella antarctica]SDB95054.1 hypothetical protein GA0111570_11165 [Raineyella antarctica]